MIDAPEKIWIEHDDCPYFYEESELTEAGSPVTEYVRADLAILSALEPSASREMALEEAARVAEQFRNNDWIAHDMRTGVFPKQSEPGVAIAAAIRALSSPDHASEYDRGVRDGIDQALEIATGQAGLMADLALEGLPENARVREAMEAAQTRFADTLRATLSDLSSTFSPDHAHAGKVEGGGWKPIESAPRDGTPVLAYQAGRYFKCWLECDRYEGGYFWQDEEDSEPSPTHWRPLPSAPSGGDRHGE